MFKAIGRWGSQVRSSINLQFFSNIFGSKSKRYDDLGNEDEEVFIDAQEDISEESDTEDVHKHVKHEPRDPNTDSKNDIAESGDVKTVETNDGSKEEIVTKADIVVSPEVKEEVINDLTDAAVGPSNPEESKIENNESETDKEASDAEHGGDTEDDDHHINHKDTKQIVKNSKQSNGLVHSASASMIQKVHRRMNSYSQRQYSKFDNAQDDENDNTIQYSEDCSKDQVDSNMTGNPLEEANVIKNEKKTKRKKKVAFFQFFRGFFRLNSRPASTRIS